jgi:hypothetical protein
VLTCGNCPVVQNLPLVFSGLILASLNLSWPSAGYLFAQLWKNSDD